MDYGTLVEQVLSGNQDAWNSLYQMTYQKIYYTCMCFVKNEQETLDMVQEAYTSAWEHLGKLQDRQQFEAWLIRIAVNKCKNYLKQTNMFYLNDVDAMVDCEEENENFLPESYAVQQEKRQLVFHIMSNVLSETLYRTVILFYFDEMTIQEIAELMECPVGTVKYRLNAARGKIKQGVLAYEQQSGEKLYSAAGIPFLALLFHYQVYGTLPMAKAAVAASAVGSVASVTGTGSAVTGQAAAVGAVEGQAAGTAAKIGGYVMTKALKTKIIAGIAALAVVGGAAGFIIANNNKDDKKEDTGKAQVESVVNGGDFRISFEYDNYTMVSSKFDETVSDDMFKRYNLSYLESQVWYKRAYNFLVPLEIDGLRLDNEAWDYHTRKLEDVTTIRNVQLGIQHQLSYADYEYFPDSEVLDIGLYIEDTDEYKPWEEVFGDDDLSIRLDETTSGSSEYRLHNIESLTRNVTSTDEGVNPFGFSYTLEKGTMTVEEKHEYSSDGEITTREIPYNLIRFSGLTEDDINDWGFLYFDVSEDASKQAVMDDLTQVLIASFKAVEWE
ncbi:MAG: sigma-70 family RNA polymerase sigma factor [Clostridium sp.]|nr:sigma-70 family RNA polymerase sigma factor [Clostridium sp.]MCM1460511.1 sigma-70 family RNA polymerase sigma factor [Bacteroides sp.]